ncbi:MAG TPA: hypothetical protein VJN50_08880 [Actinomycetota bacterium]|nr:hypothetical protein [Actinomycetota bacterium]
MSGGSSRPRVQTIVLVALGAAAVAVGIFGIPLGTVLLVGVWLLCPLLMMGMHGDHAHTPGSERSDHGDPAARES